MMIEQKYITKQLVTFGHHELEFGDESIFDHKSKEEIKHCIIKDKKSMFALESCESNGVFYVSKKRHKLRNNETIVFDESIRDRDSEIIFDKDTNYIIAKEKFSRFLKFYVFYHYLEEEKCSESIDITKTKKIYCIKEVISALSEDLIYIMINKWNKN